MADTHFVDGTTVTSAWANDVNEATYSQVTAVANVRALNSTRIRYAQTKGYTTAGDGGHGRYYMDASDTTSADNGGTVLVGADGARWKLIHEGKISVKLFGLGSNTSNDISGYQTMVRAARDQGFTIFFPKNTKCFIQFSTTTPHLYIDGLVNIEGEDRWSCGIRINVNYTMPSGHAPLFMWGVPSLGGTVNKVSGTIRGIGMWLTAACGRFESANHVYGADGLHVTDCYADFTQVTWPNATVGGSFDNGYQAGGWWRSNNQPSFAVGQTQDRNIWFTNNIGFASAEYKNAESIGFTNVRGLHYINNYLSGWSDDLAAHTCVNVLYKDNHYEAVSGRLFVANSHFVKIIDNVIIPLERPITTGFLGPVKTYIHVTMSTVENAAITTDPANYDVLIEGNTVYLPSGCYCTGGVICYGVQDALTIADNTIHNDGATSPVSAVSVQSVFNAAWTGLVGNPDYASGGAVKIRSCKIDGNKTTGAGWVANEGTIGISVDIGGASTDVIGPVTINENEAGNYYIPYDTVDFRDTNRVIPASTDPYLNVHPKACDRLAKVWSAPLITSQLLEGADHPLATPAAIKDAYALDFIAQEDGGVRGVVLTLTSGNHLTLASYANVQIKKNGSNLGSAVAFTEIGNSPNSYKYQVSFFGTSGMTFAKNDNISVFLYFSASQVTAIAGRCDLICLYE